MVTNRVLKSIENIFPLCRTKRKCICTPNYALYGLEKDLSRKPNDLKITKYLMYNILKNNELKNNNK